jgi:hypothetical protein
MNSTTLQNAILEAERFLRAAKIAQKSSNELSAGKENGAAKRASLDLTRALAEMRKTG